MSFVLLFSHFKESLWSSELNMVIFLKPCVTDFRQLNKLNIFLKLSYLGMPLTTIEMIFQSMVSVRTKCVYHILYFGFWKSMWAFHSVASTLQCGQAILFSSPLSSLHSWEIQGNYIDSFIIFFNPETKQGSIILNCLLCPVNKIATLTFAFYLILFSKCQFSPLYTELCPTIVEFPSLVPHLYIVLVFRNYWCQHLRSIIPSSFSTPLSGAYLCTSVTCSAVKWNYFEEAGIVLLRIAPPGWHHAMSNGVHWCRHFTNSFYCFLRV